MSLAHSPFRVLLTVATLALAAPAAAQPPAPPAARTTEADADAVRKLFEPIGFGVRWEEDRVVASFSNTPATDDLLKRLPQTDLRFTLAFWDGQVTAAGLTELARFPNMEGLHLPGCAKVTDETVAALTALPALQDLDLRKTGMTPKGLRALAGAKRLDSLGIGGPLVTDEALTAVAAVPRIRTLSVHDADQVTGKGLAALAALPRLEELEFTRCPKVGPGLDELARFQRLRGLFLVLVPVSEVAMKTIGGLGALEQLALDRTGATDAGIQELRGLRRLSHLWVFDTAGLTDAGLGTVSELPGLRELSLEKCPKITDQGLVALAKAKGLRKLTVSGCKGVTARGVTDLQGRLPACEIHGPRPR